MASFEALAESPLGARGDGATPRLQQDGLELIERPFSTHVVVRAADAEAASAALRDQCGVALPSRPNTVTRAADDGVAALWRGPDEWLLLVTDGRPAPLASLSAALRPARAVAVDVSSGQTVIAVRGARARALLARLCTLDLHPEAFRVDRCADTRLAKTAGLLWRCADDEYQIVVRRSFARYLWNWCRAATALLTDVSSS